MRTPTPCETLPLPNAQPRSLDITKKQLQLGQIAYLLVLNAQNTYAQARLALVQAQANRLADTAALFQALGGGWWHRPNVPTASNNGQNVSK
jgi:outer membrane protein TolC